MVTHLGRSLLIVLAAAQSGLAAAPAENLSRFEYTETHMGSPFKLVLYTENESTARSASQAAYARIAALDAIMSDYKPDSELMRLCERAGGPPVVVSDDLLEVLTRSKSMYERSQGAFDVTVAPVVRLWLRARRDGKMPDPDRLAQALSLVGSDRMILDAKAKTVQLLKAGMKLDLGGIAKGYASDEAIQTLKSRGVTRALAAGAGDIVVSGPPPESEGWTIAVAALNSRKPPERIFSLRDAAVSTAGDSEQYVEIGGRRYSHIVDPRTGLGVVDRCTVTIIARDGSTADSLDTAAYILGPKRALPLIESMEGVAGLIQRESQDSVQTFESASLRQVRTARPHSSSLPEFSLP